MRIHAAYILVLSCVLLLVPLPSSYAEEENRELAMALIGADGSDGALENVAKLITQQHAEALRSKHPKIKPKGLEKYTTYLLEELLEQKGDLLHTIASLYAQHFTTQEMQQLLAFYQTPLGGKLVIAQVRMQEKIVPLTFEWGASAVQHAAARVHDRLKKEGVEL